MGPERQGKEQEEVEWFHDRLVGTTRGTSIFFDKYILTDKVPVLGSNIAYGPRRATLNPTKLELSNGVLQARQAARQKVAGIINEPPRQIRECP